MDSKGFVAALLDLSFSEFVTTKVIKILYILLLVMIGLGVVFGVITGLIGMFTNSFLSGVAVVLFSLVGGVIYVIFARIFMELIIVVFRIAENTSEMVRMKKSDM